MTRTCDPQFRKAPGAHETTWACVFPCDGLQGYREPAERRAQKLAMREAFASALTGYRKGAFAEAGERFSKCAAEDPLDRAAALYVQRCTALLARTAARWDGITALANR